MSRRGAKAIAVVALVCALVIGWNSALRNDIAPAEAHTTKPVSKGSAAPETRASRTPLQEESAKAVEEATQLVGRAKVTSVSPDANLDSLFTDYGNSGQGWTGGDGGASTELPDGRIFWAFSDTWLGPVSPGGTRPPDKQLLSNVAVIQSGSRLTTLYGGTPSAPAPFLTTGMPHVYYWNNGAIVANNTLYVSYSGYFINPWTFTFPQFDTIFAEYSLPSLSLETLTAVDLGPKVKWGICMLNDGGYTYIYGAGFGSASYNETYMYVARAPQTDVLGPWQFFTGTSWSDNPNDAAPLNDVVRDPYSVGKVGGVYVLFTMQDAPFSTEMQAYFGPTPVGPFSHGQDIYSTTATPGLNASSTDEVYEYGAYLHPEFTKGDTVVLSYQVNSRTAADYAVVSLIRPRYLDITIGFDDAATQSAKTTGRPPTARRA